MSDQTNDPNRPRATAYLEFDPIGSSDPATGPILVEYYRQAEGEPWECEPVALFPESTDSDGVCQSYMRLGQYSPVDLDYLRSPESGYVRADPDSPEVRALRGELLRMGYRLRERR